MIVYIYICIYIYQKMQQCMTKSCFQMKVLLEGTIMNTLPLTWKFPGFNSIYVIIIIYMVWVRLDTFVHRRSGVHIINWTTLFFFQGNSSSFLHVRAPNIYLLNCTVHDSLNINKGLTHNDIYIPFRSEYPIMTSVSILYNSVYCWFVFLIGFGHQSSVRWLLCIFSVHVYIRSDISFIWHSIERFHYL